MTRFLLGGGSSVTSQEVMAILERAVTPGRLQRVLEVLNEDDISI